jgi:hypothetical protein
MNKFAIVTAIGAFTLGVGGTALAQASSGSGIPVTKDRPAPTSTTGSTNTSTTTSTTTTTTSNGDIDWNGPLGYSLRPGSTPVYCAANDPTEVAKIAIKSDLYTPATMISPEQAKALALCAVPGQISSGEMKVSSDGVTVYEVSVLPTGKQTYSTVQINASNGDVINAKQFGGLRGLAGYLKESAARKNNKTAP